MAELNYDGQLTLAMNVTDRAKSVSWYEKHLGFSKLFDADDIGWTEMITHIEGVTVGFGDAMHDQAGNCVPVFGVDDLAASRQQLEQAGVSFDGETIDHENMVKLATFTDPDGNLLMLSQNMMEN